jgi:hypothetical protein
MTTPSHLRRVPTRLGTLAFTDEGAGTPVVPVAVHVGLRGHEGLRAVVY